MNPELFYRLKSISHMYAAFKFHSDFNIKVVTVADGSQKILKGHEAPVLSVAIDPKDQYIVSTT